MASRATPNRVGRERHISLWKTDAGDSVSIRVGSWHENRIRRTHEKRRHRRQNAFIEEGTVVEQVASSHQAVESDAGDLGETDSVLR